MSSLIYECILAALTEIVPIAAASAILRIISERGLKAIAESAARPLLARILRSLGSRIIPALGVAWTLYLIYQAIRDCS
jgi:hypothetical protein